MAGGSVESAQPLCWDKPDFAVLYSFNTHAEYEAIVSALKAGKLWNVREYRAVSLQRE